MRTFVLAALIGIALFASADADHCTTWTTSVNAIDVGGGYYMTQGTWPACPEGLIYAESNAIPGLQRDDHCARDTCHGIIEGDTLVY